MRTRLSIYDRLRMDHDVVHDLLDRLVASTDGDEWRLLIDEINATLIPHSRAEEAVFYNSIHELDHATRLVMHTYAEHARAETDLRFLQTMKSVDTRWLMLARKIRSDLLQHVAEEEGKVFPAAMRLLGDEEAVLIGRAFDRLKRGIKDDWFTQASIDLAAHLMPPRLVASFRRVFPEAQQLSKAA